MLKKWFPAFSIPGSLNLKKILKDNSGKKGKNVEIKNTDTAFLQYTGRYYWPFQRSRVNS